MPIETRMILKRSLLAAVLFVLAVSPVQGQQIQTPAELSGFTEYTTYSEMMDYLKAVQGSSTEMSLTIYGESYEGRELPVAIFGRPRVRQPWEALVSGKPIALVAANVHGNEPTLRESLLILIRELATKGSPENGMLDGLVILVVPSINPDGQMAEPRPTRGNSWGIDLNRDYMKLEQEALASYVTNLVNTWHPYVVVDGHNGGSYPYNICYAPTSHDTPDKRIIQLCNQEIFPYMNGRMEENGYRSFYYSGAARNNPGVWNTGGYDPRISRNYVSFTNSIGILFESPGGQDMETGIRSGLVGYKSILEFALQNPEKVMDIVNSARWETVQMGSSAEGEITVEQTYGPEDFTVTYQVRVDRDSPLITVTSDSLMQKPVPLLKRERPYAYLLPRDAVAAVEMLKRHNIAIEVLQDTLTLEVQAYVPGEITYMREYNHDAAVAVEVAEVVTFTQRFPTGTYVIPTGQIMGRVASHLLEPETNDNVVRWNTMDAWLPLSPARGFGGRGGRGGRGGGGEPPPRVIPIYKVMQPVPMPTRVIH